MVVVPTMVYYGLQLIEPKFFILICCVTSAIVSVMTGSSWTTIATIGVALMGIGQGKGLPTPWIAGAIISGAYFGDKMSPLSDTTVIASSSSGTPLFEHIKYLMITTIPDVYYDKQMCVIEGEDERILGKLTTEMVGTSLQQALGEENWVFEEGLYPRLKGMEDSDEAVVNASPVFLYVSEDGASFETIDDDVYCSFEVSTVNGEVTWTSNSDAVVIEGTDAIVYSRGVDPIEITASKNDVVKTIALKVTTLYEDIILGDSEIICVDETTNEITLTATEERIEGVTYSWSDGDNVVGDDYELTLSNLNLEHIPIQ